MAAVSDGPVSIFDGDIIQLYCPTESGYVYSEPNSKTELKLDIHKDKIHIPDFAVFCITLKKGLARVPEKTENIFYGSVVSLEHQASELFLTAKSNNEVNISEEMERINHKKSKYFRVVPPNQEAIWGKELKDYDSIRLESISFDALMVHFQFKNNCYESSLEVNGTVFAVKSYCHKCRDQNPNSIKGGKVIVLAKVLKMKAYMCAKDSFVAKLPSPNQSSSPQELQQSPPCTQEGSDSKIGLTMFMERPFSELPENGDTFFLMEKVKGRAGDPILFGEQCRIKHLFTFQYISVTPQREVILHANLIMHLINFITL